MGENDDEELAELLFNKCNAFYNGIDDYHRENNDIDVIYDILKDIFNKLKVYYDEGLLPVDLHKSFIEEWKRTIKKNKI